MTLNSLSRQTIRLPRLFESELNIVKKARFVIYWGSLFIRILLGNKSYYLPFTYLILLRNRYYSKALYRTLSNRRLGSSFEEVYKNRFVSLYERLNKYYFEQKRLRILIKIL